MRKIIYLAIAAIALSCTNQEKNLPSNFDFGETGDGVYTNDFFDLEIHFNPNWFIQDIQQMNSLLETSTEIVAGGDENLKAVVKASQVNTAYLLTLFKYELGAAVDFNPSFMVIAENTKSFPGIKTGSDYLFHAMKLMEQSQMEYSFEKEVSEKTIGESAFHILEVQLNYMNNTIIQEYMSTVRDGFSLTFIVSYITEDERNELYEIIGGIKI